MRYLTVQEILFIHDRLVEERAGAHGVRDLVALEAAIARPEAGGGETVFYREVFAKAAALLAALVAGTPFVDGNAPTGIAAAGVFLELNGWRLTATNDEVAALAGELTAASPREHPLAVWLARHSARV